MLVAVAAAASHAFAAPVPGGAGFGRVSGYTIADVDYSLAPTESTRLGGVSFSLEPPGPRTVRVEVGGRHATCTVVAGRATCPFAASAPRVEDIGSLTIVALG